MDTIKVDKDLELVLVHQKLSKSYLKIVLKQRDYLSQWLTWPPHANDEQFFINFINRSLDDYAAGKSLTCAMMFKGEVVGNISFNVIDHSLKKVEIGY